MSITNFVANLKKQLAETRGLRAKCEVRSAWREGRSDKKNQRA